MFLMIVYGVLPHWVLLVPNAWNWFFYDSDLISSVYCFSDYTRSRTDVYIDLFSKIISQTPWELTKKGCKSKLQIRLMKRLEIWYTKYKTKM